MSKKMNQIRTWIEGHLKSDPEVFDWMQHPKIDTEIGVDVDFNYNNEKREYRFSIFIETEEDLAEPFVVYEVLSMMCSAYNEWIRSDVKDFKKNAELGSVDFAAGMGILSVRFLDESIRELIL